MIRSAPKLVLSPAMIQIVPVTTQQGIHGTKLTCLAQQTAQNLTQRAVPIMQQENASVRQTLFGFSRMAPVKSTVTK